MRHTKMMMTDVDGKPALFLQTNSSRRARRSVENGQPSNQVKEWARQLIRVSTNNATIQITDGTTFKLNKDRKKVYVIKQGSLFESHKIVFESIGMKLIDKRPEIVN